MPEVRDLIAHILHHTNAEAADSDLSQVAGVSRRAQLVRDAVQYLRTDARDISIRDILQSIFNAIPNGQGRVSFRRAIENMRAEDDTRPQLAIQEWVSKQSEGREVING